MVVGIAINRAWNIYNFRQGIIRSLIEAGHTVVAIAPRDEYVERLQKLGCIFEHVSMTDTGSNPFNELKVVIEFHRIIKRQKIEVLLNYTIKCNLYGSLVASWNHIPTICNISGLGTAFLSPGFSSGIARFLSSRWLRSASHLFFQNQDDRKDFLAATKLSDVPNSLLPGSGVDLDRFKSVNDNLPNEYHFILLARLIIEKGVREYVEAASIVKQIYPEVKFLIVGSLDEAHARSISKLELEHWVANDWIDYLPHRDDIPELISLAEVAVLPSYREGTPRSLLEAGACGKPLITTDVPGCREVVTDKLNGFLCKARSSIDLADKMKDYLKMGTEEKLRMGQASRRLIENRFDENHVIRAYLDKIDELT